METPEKIAKSLPHTPGVYLFYDSAGQVIYVGKAKDLKRRVSQYFDRAGQDQKTVQLVSHIHTIKTIKTHSEFDALLLEAKLIRRFIPKYNIIAKDDKSPLYLCISKEEQLPRISYVRKSSIVLNKKRHYFGPFQSGRTLRKVMRQLRTIIPYCMQKKRDGKPCFYTHLGLCNPCPSAISDITLIKKYQTHIKKISDILSGRSLKVLHDMEDQMKRLAEKNLFEEAESVKLARNRLRQLIEEHYDPLLYEQGDAFLENMYESEMSQLRNALVLSCPNLKTLKRIECIDISNTMGKFAAGSLVVLADGRPSTGDYRRFRIKSKNTPHDVAMIAEVLTRRLKHNEWPYPDLLVIDGGKGQVTSAKNVLVQNNVILPVIGLAKRFEEIIVPVGEKFTTIRLPMHNKGLRLLERIRDESHRFALAYHRLLRKQNFLV